MLAVARSLLSLTRGKLLINALLPRGDRSMYTCICMQYVTMCMHRLPKCHRSLSPTATHRSKGPPTCSGLALWAREESPRRVDAGARAAALLPAQSHRFQLNTTTFGHR